MSDKIKSTVWIAKLNDGSEVTRLEFLIMALLEPFNYDKSKYDYMFLIPVRESDRPFGLRGIYAYHEGRGVSPCLATFDKRVIRIFKECLKVVK